MNDSSITSPNFRFLSHHNDALLRLAAFAERYVFEDPNTALIKIRQLAEGLAKGVAAQVGIAFGPEDTFRDIERSLRDRGLLDQSLHQIMRSVRLAGNEAVHELAGTRREAFHKLKLVRQLAVWFHKTVTGNTKFKAGPFTPPPNPADADETLKDELHQLRESLANKQAELEGIQLKADELAARVEEAKAKAAVAFANEQAAMELAAETEESAAQRIKEYEQLLADVAQEQAKKTPAEQEQVVATSQKSARELDLDEFDTRKLIDDQLREAGWEVDTAELRYSKGIRPAKGRNLAIAEWPTDDGIADYVLFVGLKPIGVVEAKRKRRNARSALDQAHRYAKSFASSEDHRDNGGPWCEFKIPFAFSTNGSPYHRQLIDQSGIWFRDLRLTTNHPRALVGWYTPEGLEDLLKLDSATADNQLQQESSDYLPLRYYQREAIQAVEKSIADGKREILLAMATGTGKTRTAICLLYRLVKAARFNRILFVVDRRSLGEQAFDSFNDVKLENLQSFPEIYDVKQLGDITPDRETKLHISTIQAMVHRIVDGEDETNPFPVDQYDCIVVDECHRGYILDKEMNDQELTYRDQLDYVSKYRRVLDHFDSVRIGLTATPALHTSDIFGKPVYEYSYRKAVIDKNLVDHEPPFIIKTELSEKGLEWKAGDQVKVFDTFTKSISTEQTPDEIKIDIEGFNSVAITEPFNEAVCGVLAKYIDPFLPGKTLIFCVRDSHADTVVRLLTDALEDEHGSLPHDTVKKITGDVDRTSEAIRRFKNESAPKIVVTVDLLTTGIDVPSITNIVFLRCTKSRILFEQMIGRATRLCEDLHGVGEDKEYFHIYDAVGIYEKLQNHTDMKPVVASPKTSFAKLVGYLASESDSEILADIQDQVVSKLRRKAKSILQKWPDQFSELAGGDPESVAETLSAMSPEELKAWFESRSILVTELDRTRPGGTMLVSEETDRAYEIQRGYGNGQRPDDYLESFRSFLAENMETIPALLLVTQRPRELTRKDLLNLQMQLAQNGFSETTIKAAVRDSTNQDIAASIIGFVRHAMLDEPLIAYEDRVDLAIRRILGSQAWQPRQRQWLERIGKQIKENVVVDQDILNSGAFKDQGGFARLNKVFGGRLDELLRQIVDDVWQTAT
ncbi:type I restriction-modification system endonuclease [Planctomycetes bacterium K23_9]|uniref:Type-1 restriction enzyme R protein n=1 Tax=Stieleria marina TaxID=1930275 RepID=A0A517NUG3_9BACT|nr:Type-1 restriction enzyme R protein [Planctomycetes bacterium K23_9]